MLTLCFNVLGSLRRDRLPMPTHHAVLLSGPLEPQRARPTTGGAGLLDKVVNKPLDAVLGELQRAAVAVAVAP